MHGAVAVLVRMRACAFVSLFASLVASCTPAPGEDAGAGADAGDGAVADPLDLASCPSDPAAWDALGELPPESWSAGDEQAAMCALRAIDPAVAAKRIVCAGENNHGVSESSRWHALLARYLVHRFAVRTIAFEAPAETVVPWDRYLETGDPADLALAFDDATGSLLDMIEQERLVDALRALQGELPAGERLRLTGFDIAVQPHLTRASVLAFLAIVAPAEVVMWEAALPDLAPGVDWAAAGLDAADLHTQIEANESAYVAATDEASWRAARRNAANLRDGYLFLDYYFAGNFSVGDATFREPGMIRNIEEILAEALPGEPVLVFAHDLHCARDYIIGTTELGAPSPAVGTHLADTYGADYLMVAQLYLGGSYLARLPAGFTPTPFSAAGNSLEAALGAATSAGGLLFGTSTTVVPMDLPWPIWNQPSFVPQDEYDAILWLREVTPTTPRP